MKMTGWKHTAGGWVRQQLLGREVLACMFLTVIAGWALGFVSRGSPVFDGPAGILASWVATGLVILLCVVLFAYLRRLDATWLPGLRAERRIGDLIDHAVTQRGCAVAHDVKEALGGRGNVDHVVTTPAGIWVVETKSRWLSKERFHAALHQVAENVGRVRSHLKTSLPVRGALVIADPAKNEHEKKNDRNGEAVWSFGGGTFWRMLKAECEQPGADAASTELARVAREVWKLGTTPYPDS